MSAPPTSVGCGLLPSPIWTPPLTANLDPQEPQQSFQVALHISSLWLNYRHPQPAEYKVLGLEKLCSYTQWVPKEPLSQSHLSFVIHVTRDSTHSDPGALHRNLSKIVLANRAGKYRQYFQYRRIRGLYLKTLYVRNLWHCVQGKVNDSSSRVRA